MWPTLVDIETIVMDAWKHFGVIVSHQFIGDTFWEYLKFF